MCIGPRCRRRGRSVKWRRIRYDNCSPEIRGGLIFLNARSGIYASGKTKQALTGLMAISRSCSAEFDKAPFRPLVRKWVTSSSIAHRQAALSALLPLGADPADLDVLYTLAENRRAIRFRKEKPGSASALPLALVPESFV